MEFYFDKHWMLKSLVMLTILVASCHSSRRRRAIPDYPMSPTENKGNNSITDVQDEFRKFWKKQNRGLCPLGQVPHRDNTVCCYVTVCGPEYEIEECLVNGTKDKCSKCKDNYLQYHNISSLNMEDAKCFPKVRDHQECPAGDMRKASKIMHEDNFPLPCECKLEKCYIEDYVGSCTLKSKCQPDFQLNKTGTCEPCPWYSFKNVVGCEPCTINETLLTYGIPGGVFIRTTTAKAGVEEITSEENQSLPTHREVVQDSNKKGHGLDTIYIISLALALTVIVVLIIYCWRKRMAASSVNAPPTPSADNAPLLPGQVILTPTGNGTGYGNILYQPNNHGYLIGTHDINRNLPETDFYTNNVLNGYAGNGHAGNGHAGNGHAGNGHVIDNLKVEHRIDMDGNVSLNGGHRIPVGMGSGRTPNGTVANSVPERALNGRVHHPPDELNISDRDVKPKGTPSKQKEEKRSKTVLLQASLVDKDKFDRYGNENEQSLQGACGGEAPNVDDNNKNLDTEHDVPKELKENKKNKGSDAVSFHGNTFKDCKIIISGMRTQVHHGSTGRKEKVTNPVDLSSVSGTFEMDSSLNSEESLGISADLTLKQPGRRSGKQKEEKVNDEFQNKPFPRPELDGSSGVRNPGGNLSNQELKLNSMEKYPAGGEDVGMDDSTEEEDVEAGKGLLENGEEPVGVAVAPLLPSIARGRPMARVQPTVRQNSGGELRHVSGHPSRPPDDDSASSVGSMSYAMMHMNSGLDNGFISRDVANTDDLIETDDSESHHLQSVIYEDVQRNRRADSITDGGQRQLVGNADEHKQTTQMQTNFNAPPLTRRDANRVGTTNSVPPMCQREGPEGNSITYTPESDHFTSRPDLQQTDRKVPVNETDQSENETNEKQVGSNSTSAKAVDIDADLTKFKNIKEAGNLETDTDLKKPIAFEGFSKDLKKDVEGNSNIVSTDDSFELNSEDVRNEYNVENILYEDDKATDGEKSLNEQSENGGSESSFELNSRDIEKIETSEKSSNCDSVNIENGGSESSFELNSKDIEKIETSEKSSNCDSVNIENGGSESSFELNSKDIEKIETSEKSSNCDSVNIENGGSESSFELNSKDIEKIETSEKSSTCDSVDIENGGSESSFELKSKDIEKIEISKELSTFDSVITSQSYEVDVTDIQKIQKASDEICDIEESDVSFEIDRHDLEQIETDNVLLTKKPMEDRNYGGETSFEINNSEIDNLELNRVRDVREATDGRSETGESIEVTNKDCSDSQYSPMTSSDELSDTDGEEREKS